MIRKEDLGIDDIKIFQDDELYCFTSDAVLLSRFATVKKGDVVADFCSGSGIVGLNLYALNKNSVKSVTLFEMQKELFDLSGKTIDYNKLGDVFTAVNVKVQDISDEYVGKFSLIVCNPPYGRTQDGFASVSEHIKKCKFEIELTLKELVKAVARALKFGGRFALVHRADRLADIFEEMRANNVEPKRLCVVSAANGKTPYLVLVEGVKGGKSGLKILNGEVN